MIQANTEANVRVNALPPHRPEADVPLTHGAADLPGLRQRWATIEAGPVICEHREDGVDQSFLGLDVRTFLSGAQSAGQMSVHSIVLAPGAGLPTHYHDDVETYLIVVEGTPTLRIGDREEAGAPFSFAFAPPRTRVGFRNESDAAVWLNLVYKPAGYERAFAECHALWTERSDTDEASYIEVLSRYGYRFDAAKLERDARVNASAPQLPFELDAADALERLRSKLYDQSAVPRLVHSTPEEIATDGVDPGFRKRVLGGEESAGSAMVNFVSRIPPAPEHYQPTEEELFFILDGQLKLVCGNETVVLERGGFASAPRNCTHGFGPPEPGVDHKFMTINSPAGHEHAMAALRRMPKQGMTREKYLEVTRYGGFVIQGAMPKY